jgi:hypothetical protein
MVQQLVDQLDFSVDMQPVTLLALDNSGNGKPGYVLLLAGECQNVMAEQTRLARKLEESLLALFHYRLARDLNQLAPVRVLCREDMQQSYLRYCQQRGMIDGNVKVEPLRYWPGMALAEMVADEALEGVA